MAELSYVLVTPARNEGAHIGKTLQAVCAQTCLPARWVIVSDGSMDDTEKQVAAHAERHAFIVLVTTSGDGHRGVAAKVAAIRRGTELLTGPYDFWGNLDADISFEPNYFETLLGRFAGNPRLGIGGGIVHELIGERFHPQRVSLESVAGAVQLFRRQCYEDVGGYLPVEFGGEDAAAEFVARSKGWEVETFPDLRVLHHRRVGLGTGPFMSCKFRQGRMDRVLGYHPLFEFFRCCYRSIERPYVVGGALRFLGYVWSALRGDRTVLPPDVVAHLRGEQMKRLWGRGGRKESDSPAGG